MGFRCDNITGTDQECCLFLCGSFLDKRLARVLVIEGSGDAGESITLVCAASRNLGTETCSNAEKKIVGYRKSEGFNQRTLGMRGFS